MSSSVKLGAGKLFYAFSNVSVYMYVKCTHLNSLKFGTYVITYIYIYTYSSVGLGEGEGEPSYFLDFFF